MNRLLELMLYVNAVFLFFDISPDWNWFLYSLCCLSQFYTVTHALPKQRKRWQLR